MRGHRLRTYVGWRLVQALPLVFGVSLAGFGILHASPGSPTDVYLSARISPAAAHANSQGLGLSHPWLQQYWRWLTGFFTGHLGVSDVTREPVARLLAAALPNTLWLIGPAMAVTLGLALGWTIFRAGRSHRYSGRWAAGCSLVAMALPDFWIGLVLLLAVAKFWPQFPVGGAPFTMGIGGMTRLVLPVFTLAIANAGAWARYLDAALQTILQETYVEYAALQGFRRAQLLYHHIGPNLVGAILTLLGSQALPAFVGGAVIVESLFNWPGMGQLLWTAVLDHDYPVMLDASVLLTVMTIAGNLLADLGYAWIDPRWRAS